MLLEAKRKRDVVPEEFQYSSEVIALLASMILRSLCTEKEQTIMYFFYVKNILALQRRDEDRRLLLASIMFICLSLLSFIQ